MVEVFDDRLSAREISEENFPNCINDLALVPLRGLPIIVLTFSTAVVRRGWVPVHATVPRRS